MKRNNLTLFVVLAMLGCTPTVQVQAPDKPIEINMNVNIEQHVKVESNAMYRIRSLKTKTSFKARIA